MNGNKTWLNLGARMKMGMTSWGGEGLGSLISTLEESAARRHISSNAYCFSEPPQDLPLARPFPS